MNTDGQYSLSEKTVDTFLEQDVPVDVLDDLVLKQSPEHRNPNPPLSHSFSQESFTQVILNIEKLALKFRESLHWLQKIHICLVLCINGNGLVEGF